MMTKKTVKQLKIMLGILDTSMLLMKINIIIIKQIMINMEGISSLNLKRWESNIMK